jgi:hypothetical protein
MPVRRRGGCRFRGIPSAGFFAVALIELGDDGFAGFLLDLADSILELETVRGDVAGSQRGLDGAQLADQRRARLLIDRTTGRPVVLRQGGNRLPQQLFIVRHWVLVLALSRAVLAKKLSLGTGHGQEWYPHARDWSKAAPPARRSVPRAGGHI